MSKLFSDVEPVVVKTPPPIHLLSKTLDQDLVSLESHTDAYCSVGNISDVIAAESYSFVNTGNVALYNEYVGLLAKTFQIEAPKRVDILAFESDSVMSVNASIALEGWMADIWKKIKATFTSIGDTMKKFATSYFTNLGRVKKGLENLKTVLDKTDKDLSAGAEVELPSALAALMTGHKDISPRTIGEGVKTAKELVEAFDKIAKASKTIIDVGFLTPDFISSINRLKEQALSASESIKNNNANRDGPLGKFGKNNKAITAANKKLTDIQRDAETDAAQAESAIDAVGKLDQGEEQNHEEAIKHFKTFADDVIAELTPIINKPLMGGKVIKAVKLTDDNKLEIESGDAEGEPETMSPGSKSDLLNLIKSAQDSIATAEAAVKMISDINDKANKAMDTVDKLVADIDKGDPERYGKFKNVITQSVRTRLKLLQSFYTNYNKIGKNALDISANAGKAVITYATTSLSVYK